MKSLSVVVPVFNASHTIEEVLRPIQDALSAGDIEELLVVDDCSTDDGPEYCRAQGIRVLRTEVRSGPARARNLGVANVKTDLVLFIDADVVMHADAPRHARAAFESRPNVAAVFGSYDDRPRATNYVSQYVNLRHHHIHQNGAEQASTFWSGCGAVDRATFLEIGGFNAERYQNPAVEDIELGMRLRSAGKTILLCKQMQGTHLKYWTLGNLISTDIFQRALPWVRLMGESDVAVDALNVSWSERGKALLVGLIFVSLAVAVFQPSVLALSALLLALAFLSNRRFFLLVFRQAGLGNMLAAVCLHQLYYTYSSIVFVYGAVEKLFKRPRG